MQTPDFYRYYRPLTAHPFECGETYAELAPGDALAPFVRCFWGSHRPSAHNGGRLVIPDTCADLIFRFDRSRGAWNSVFCGLSDTPFTAPPDGAAESFAIRFHFWALPCFTDFPPTQTRNTFLSGEVCFPALCRELTPLLFHADDLATRARETAHVLLRHLDTSALNAGVLNAVSHMLTARGAKTVADAARYANVGPRQLERLFTRQIGLPPKTLCRLVRYQKVWQAIASGAPFDPHTAVYALGYHDQPHLLHEFKGFHSLSPAAAAHVAFLQYDAPSFAYNKEKSPLGRERTNRYEN